MEERQPGDAAVAFVAFQGREHLRAVGGQVQLGDLDASRGPGRTGGVLQVGDGGGVDLLGIPRGRYLAGRLRKNLRTPSAASLVVRIAAGSQSSRTACRRPTWPGSD